MWILDLDGVVWLLDRPIEGSAEAISTLRRSGESLRFVTNNSVLTVSAYLEKFKSFGIDVVADEIVSSSMAVRSILNPKERVYVIGGGGLKEQVAKVAEVVDDHEADQRGVDINAVVVGWDRHFDFDKLRRAMWAVQGGARLIGSNGDPTYPTPDGSIPGAGSILAAVEAACECKAEVAGKPNSPMVELVRSMMDNKSVMVGDRYSTDGAFAWALDIPFYLVRSGVEEEIPSGSRSPDVTADTLGRLVSDMVGQI